MTLSFAGHIGLIGDPAAAATRDLHARLLAHRLLACVDGSPRVHFEPFVVRDAARDEASGMRLYDVVEHLAARGASRILLPCAQSQALLDDIAAECSVPVVAIGIDACLDHALHAFLPARPAPFRVGVVGGIGPAATVDFLDKLVRTTPATSDQEHIRIVVDQNPQIPDRTAHLQGRGPDPTMALYATCRRLCAAGASVIVMPCNTAHAYLDRLRAAVPVPLIDMPAETIAALSSQAPAARRVGLLATSGTVDSGVYARAALGAGLSLLTPLPAWQDKVMNAIYGARGIKAGHREGDCVTDTLEAISHLAQRGAQAIILGCTELPLLFPGIDTLAVGGRSVPLLDPGMLAARRCVELALHHAPLRSKRAGENGAGSANGDSQVMISASKRPVAGPSVSP